MRFRFLSQFVGALALTSAVTLAHGAPDAIGHHKATGPVRIEIELPESTSGAFVVTYRATSERSLSSLRTELRLPQGGQVLEARAIEAGVVEAQESRAGWARVRLPSGGSAVQIEVCAWFVLETSDGGVFMGTSELVTVGTGPLFVDARPVSSGGLTTRDVAASRSPETPLAATQSGPTVRGVFHFVEREATFTGGWSSVDPELPIRLAEVRVLDAATDTLLASGVTALDGSFELPLPGTGTADLVIRCLSSTQVFGPLPFAATDSNLTPYSVSSSTFVGWDLSAGLDLGTIVAQKTYVGSKQGSPFSQLDVLVNTGLYLDSLGAPPASSSIYSIWPGGTQTQASQAFVYLSSDDGYDDSVLLHEAGHAVGNLYSDTDHGGGSHSFGQSDQWPSLSMGEGYATFFGGAVRQFAGVPDPGVYIDCSGGPGVGPGALQLRLNFETGFPWTSLIGGEADEVAIVCALWDVIDTASTADGDALDDDPVDGTFLFPGGRTGDQLLWDSYTGATVLAAEDLSIFQVFNGLFLDGGAVEYDALVPCFDGFDIRFYEDAAEPDNDAASAKPLPLGHWSPIRTLYSSPASPPVPGDGDVDQVTFFVEAGQLLEVETRYPGGKSDAGTYCDPFLELYGPDEQLIALDDNSGAGRNARIEVATTLTGTFRAVVRSLNSARPTGSYELRARMLGPLQPPHISSISPSSTETLTAGALTSVLLGGTGFAGITQVSVGGVLVESFWVTDDDTIAFVLPIVDQLGKLAVQVKGPAGSHSIALKVSVAPQPTLLAGNGLIQWNYDTIQLRAAAQPGETIFVLLGFEEGLTSFPGIVDLSIGNGYLYLLWTANLNAAGIAAVSVPLDPSIVGGLPVWLQGAVLGATPIFPLATTNVVQGKVF